MTMLGSQLQDLPTVLLLILSSAFLFVLFARTERETSESASPVPIWWQRSPKSAEDLQSVTEFEWETELEGAEKTMLPGRRISAPAAVTKHPLEVNYSQNYTFRINEPNKCLEKNPFLVLLVVTEPQDIAKREAIRQTWGNESSVPGISILRLFLTGVHPVFGSPLQNLLEEESSVYRDIIQQDFMDSYNNLTLKTLMGMEWISKFCPNATYVVKADSDIFLNVNYLVSGLLQPHLPPKKDYFTGFVYRNSRPLRSKAYKNYIPKEIYPNNTYPPYCAGFGYVFSGDLATKIYQVAKKIKVLCIEDVSIGICLYELGIKVTDGPPGLFKRNKINYEKCIFTKLVAVHSYTPEELLRIWSDLQDQNKTCDH